MCNFASFVLTKDRELWLPDSDSHEQIIAHYGVHADGARGPNVLRVEITPGPTLTRFDDYRAWDYRIDQDITPEWVPRCDPAAMEDAKQRAFAALIRRAKEGFKTVDARGCPALTSLEAPKATYVDARGCAALTSLEAPKAQTVDARGCAALTSLEAPEAQTVYASGCAALTSLEAPKATYVDASGCPALTSLEAPKAQTVDASGCAALTSLEAPKAQTVYASGCAALTSKSIRALRGAVIR